MSARAPARPARPARPGGRPHGGVHRTSRGYRRIVEQLADGFAASVLAAIPASLSSRAFAVEDVRAAAQRSAAFWRSGCDSLDAVAQSQLADARGQQSHAHDPGRPRVLKVTPGFAR